MNRHFVMSAAFAVLIACIVGCVESAPNPAISGERHGDDDNPGVEAVDMGAILDAGGPEGLDDGRIDGGGPPPRDAAPPSDSAIDENGRTQDASPSDDVEPVDPVPEDELDDGRD